MKTFQSLCVLLYFRLCCHLAHAAYALGTKRLIFVNQPALICADSEGWKSVGWTTPTAQENTPSKSLPKPGHSFNRDLVHTLILQSFNCVCACMHISSSCVQFSFACVTFELLLYNIDSEKSLFCDICIK